MRNLLPEPIYSLAELVFPPRDLFQPLVMVQIDLNRESEETIATFEHRYRGPHALGIKVGHKLPMPVHTYDWGGRFVAILEESDREVLRRFTGESPNPWWSHSESGFHFFHYGVPQDAPLGHPIKLRFQIVKKGSGFPQIYGRSSLYVGRISSK
jgi:hypothetical protein